MIQIYIKKTCPFCQRTITKAHELGLKEGKDFEIINAEQGTSGREIVLKLGGKGQVPFMIDGDVRMYESSDIISYMEKIRRR